MAEGQILVDRKVLTMIPFASSFKVDRDFIVSIDQDSAYDIMQDEINVRMERLVACDLIAADHEVVTFQTEWPETTWQMFKFTHENSWWMRWLIKRRPIRMHEIREEKVVIINRYLGYPDAEIRSTRLGKPFIFEDVKVLELGD